MIISIFPSGPFATNAIVLACEKTKEAAIIDPAPGSQSYIKNFVKKHQLSPKKVLLTHSHMDHIGDAKAIKEDYRIPLYVHKLDEANVLTPGADGLPLLFPVPATSVEGYISDGENIELGELTLKVIHTPGHTPGGVCFYIAKESSLISGDTLFKGSIGNLSFPTANAESMWKSLEILAKLPPETKVYPGHGDTTSIQEESWLPQARQIFGE